MICDRVGLRVRGRLKALGRVEDLVQAEPGVWEVTLRGIPEHDLPCGKVVSRRDDRLLVRVDSQSDLHRLLAALQRHAASLLSVTPARRSLEDLLVREVARQEAA
jgi:ABC-type multidrug transport system ATPase subunit